MQVGVPVIATDVGGTGELVQHGINGLLVQPEDNVGLRIALQELLARPDRRTELVESGRQTVASDFSFGEMVLRTERLLVAAGRVME